MPNIIQTYVRWIDRISDYVGLIAMYLIFLMVGILLLDAITRNVIDIPLHWCIEAAQFTLAAYYFMGGPKTMKDGDHVRMDLLYDRLSSRGKHKMDIVTLACLMFYLVVLFIGSISSLNYAIATGETRFSMWNPSMIPIKSLMVGCIGLMIAQTLSEFFKHIAALRGESLT
ncbi:TRAP-type mannitol/chloroaromatic compound transport system permease small subunit [Celeribacter halophilus]|uniref:TRAP transporter small permease protein n=1 Tax=Celeribacter halophilus TaxID=576117 RepID=A0A1I3U1T4_9RHOB|nr:TRAP-type mannitol/chloroaromatic compound transport system permease small subunit [Celeribacter halophilus]SFJ76892.1 TRAP-type mannitol/chloroaromatic compound transport system, small permease component [Celeribacter halophilus]